MGLLGLGAHELSVVIVGDAEIRALNREFRSQDRPTDVLSFSQLETKSARGRKGRLPAQMKPGAAIPGRGRPLGDVVISIETARKQSQELGLAPRSRLRTLLIGERTALNILQRTCGIATLSARAADAVRGTPLRILDTRKTSPGMRALSKEAVRAGGASNHRFGLFDGVLIKDNHLAAVGGTPCSVADAVRQAREKYGTSVPLEVEVDTLEQLDVALAARPDMVLLDNMGPEPLREAVRHRNAAAPNVLLEASGGVTLATLRALAESGVDRISVGALTHSSPALDLALDYADEG